ncbi:MAG TPA: formate dehydrogenase accessory sulfurtransferase FdhD [bacterium]|nr:formate dehydrogenase accessory sulfurtransferase FdhD [bacterium]
MDVNILRINPEKKENIKDVVTDEVILTFYLNEKELLTLLCSPDKLKELCAGFLFSSGLINSLNDMENIFINRKNMTAHITLKDKDIMPDVLFKRVYTSGCGRGMLFTNMLDLARQKIVTGNTTIQSGKIIELMKAFNKKSIEYKKTGCIHGAALSDGESILVMSEDIGRHNAIDKVIGEALYKNLNMEKLLLITSGRISSEVMVKVEKMGSAIIVSRGAPTDLAIRLADKWNVTIVGFARGRRMNVYTAKERIV